MTTLTSLLEALDERNLARAIAIPHDESRLAYGLRSNTVADFDEFTRVIADYVQHHFSRCVSRGGSLSRADAAGRAKEILESAYRRRNGDLVTAYNDAHDGTNGGLRGVLDAIAEAMKEEAVERYIRDVFDRCVAPNSWDDKVAIIQDFIARYHTSLASSVRRDQPERYAQNYRELIRAYVDALHRTSSLFRRL